jgi:hypothetical protein
MPEIKRRVRKPKANHVIDRERLLAEFNMITEEDLAILFDVEVKTLKNRSSHDLPPFTKTGGKRLFFKDDVTAYMRRRMS